MPLSKVVFLGFPEHGHINPTVGVVKELVSRGEEVLYYCPAELQTKFANTGVQMRDFLFPTPVLEEQTVDFGKIQETTNQKLIENLMKLIDTELASCLEIIQYQKPDLKKAVMEIKPDYIIHDSCAYWGKIIAQQLSIPAISSVTVYAYCSKIFDLNPQLVIRDILGLPGCYVDNPQKTSIILQHAAKIAGDYYNVPDYDYIDKYSSREELNIVYTSKEFQWFGEVFDSSFRFVGPSICPRNDSSGFSWDTVDREKLIYISLGTLIHDLSFYYICFEAFGATDKQVILNIGNLNIEKLVNVPKNFIVRNFVPQLEILKRAAVFITHGGMNSVNEAMYFNVPVIVIPHEKDQFIVADRITELGVGIKLKNGEFNALELFEASETVLTGQSFRTQAQIIGESLRNAGGYQRAVDEIFCFKEQFGMN